MRAAMSMVSGAVAIAVLWGTAIAAPATALAGPHTVAPPAEAKLDWQKLGSDVSALIDKRLDSANISRARAAFQVGVMECMEGDNVGAANHYQEAKKLLASDREQVPISLPKS
jgi:heme oxygenase